MKKNIITVLVLAIAVVAVVEIKNRKKAYAPDSSCPDGMCFLPFPEEKMRPGSAREEPMAQQPLPRLLDLGAGKCVPCKTMAPILDEMKETFAGQLDVVFIDVWENEGVGGKYGIRMIPTQIFFDAEGKELFRHEGFYAREDMLAKWKELGYAFDEPQNIEQATSNVEGED
ncbi:Thioredoxin C-2 [Pontiella desulfatans]|uniref:Thioredoxin C-2 n=1 Tax=Pontiella desulfatans TaxID=2750659 RepID=A0A6C2UCU2_PONDE|nr:thioredoxin family protein [Pontiella desulfatans]VGO17387.1 Thioredoxin C-2 [Pontiella desulfatans]